MFGDVVQLLEDGKGVLRGIRSTVWLQGLHDRERLRVDSPDDIDDLRFALGGQAILVDREFCGSTTKCFAGGATVGNHELPSEMVKGGPHVMHGIAKLELQFNRNGGGRSDHGVDL